MGMFIRWKTIAMCAPIFPILALVLSFFIPDSPTYLISRNMSIEASSAMKQLYGNQFNIKEQATFLLSSRLIKKTIRFLQFCLHRNYN